MWLIAKNSAFSKKMKNIEGDVEKIVDNSGNVVV